MTYKNIKDFAERCERQQGTITNLMILEHLCGEILELRAFIEAQPDDNCIRTPDGGCVGGTMAGLPSCMHDPVGLK